MQKILVCLYLYFLHIKPDFWYLSLRGYGRTTDKPVINWQNFVQVGLEIKFALEYGCKPLVITNQSAVLSKQRTTVNSENL